MQICQFWGQKRHLFSFKLDTELGGAAFDGYDMEDEADALVGVE